MRTLMVASLLASACASGPQAQPASQPVAADNGQPKMQAALAALQHAKGEVEAASPNKGGHREQAIGLIQQAIDETNAGIAYANEHPTEEGAPEPPAAAEPVDENVAGAERQPHMHNGVVDLREARRQLREAKHDKGGHRGKALELIQEAIKQLKEGIQFANQHG